MYRKKVFVSFDYENDRHYKYMLEAWNAHPRFQFVFDDGTPREINSYTVGRIKAALTSKIIAATHTLVIVGQEANHVHKDHLLIGFRNWINFEVYQSKKYGKRIAAVKLNRNHASPEQLLGVNAAWALSFNERDIINALDRA